MIRRAGILTTAAACREHDRKSMATNLNQTETARFGEMQKIARHLSRQSLEKTF
jgi:hypothetical protein